MQALIRSTIPGAATRMFARRRSLGVYQPTAGQGGFEWTRIVSQGPRAPVATRLPSRFPGGPRTWEISKHEERVAELENR